MASPEFDGVIGSEILRRFKVIFDYSRAQMILESNRSFSEAYEHDMTGRLLVTEGTGFRVKQVMEDSPASAAGLNEGDVITIVNGQCAPVLTPGTTAANVHARRAKLSVKRQARRPRYTDHDQVEKTNMNPHLTTRFIGERDTLPLEHLRSGVLLMLLARARLKYD